MNILDYPVVLSVVSLGALAASTCMGTSAARRRRRLEATEREDFSIVLGATLTLLGLIIGFSFSMALNRYDQRKSLEEAEANAIGTEYLRAALMPAGDAARMRGLLGDYTRQRIAFYISTDHEQIDTINARVGKLQSELWEAVRSAAVNNPNAVTALVVAGMNDVLNAQGYTQAAWWNRIPPAAWGLMAFMAVCATFLVGYGAKSSREERGLLLVLPVVVSVAFLLIADIESPRGGFIRIAPQNLLSLESSMRTP